MMLVWVYAILIIGIVIVIAVDQFYESPKKRKKHIASHASMTDAEFVVDLGIVPDDAHWAIKLREGFAKAMGVPADTVHPTDTIEHVASFGLFDYSWSEINGFCLSKSLAISIPNKFWAPFLKEKPVSELTIADAIRFFVEHRAELD